MNTTRNHIRLNELAKEIAQLDVVVLEAERASLDCLGSEEDVAASWEAFMKVKVALDHALRAYFIEAEVVRRAEHTARQAAA